MHPNVTQALFTIAKYGSNLNIYWQKMDKEDVGCVCVSIYIWNLKIQQNSEYNKKETDSQRTN